MRKLILLLLSLSIMDAKSYLASNIATPKNYIMGTFVEVCDDNCLKQLLKEEQIFSFLAQANNQMIDKKLSEAKMIYASYFNLEQASHDSDFKVAMLIPNKVIGKYAVSISNAVFSYLLAKNESFELKTYHLKDEDNDTISSALEDIKRDGFSYVIAPLTIKGAEAVVLANPKLNIYIPTIHKSDLTTTAQGMYFGGIDYKAQIEALLEYAEGYAGLFYDPSKLGKRLNDTVEEIIDPKWVRFSSVITRKKSNLEKYLKSNELLQNGTIFVNTSTVRSGIVLSQLTLFGIEPAAILSTQINFNPLLLSITQEKDRRNMFIANSIEGHNSVFIEANKMLENDIEHDRINYATMVGVDYFLSAVTSQKREYSEEIEDNQVVYPIAIYRPTRHGFVRVD
jgi:hypothetical protein